MHSLKKPVVNRCPIACHYPAICFYCIFVRLCFIALPWLQKFSQPRRIDPRLRYVCGLSWCLFSFTVASWFRQQDKQFHFWHGFESSIQEHIDGSAPSSELYCTIASNYTGVQATPLLHLVYIWQKMVGWYRNWVYAKLRSWKLLYVVVLMLW